MRCERCRGGGRTAEYSDGRSVVVLCPACGGTGLAHCCDGERAQCEKDGETEGPDNKRALYGGHYDLWMRGYY